MRPTEHGEIWQAELDKTRPVIVVSRDDVNGRRARATVAPVTTTITDVPTHILVDHRDGFASASAINCDELQTIPKARLMRRVGRLSEAKIALLDEALRFALQLR